MRYRGAFATRGGIALPWATVTSLLLGSNCQDDNKHAGSRDCQVIAEASTLSTALELCQTCQDATCPNEGCDKLPCVEGRFVVRGCEEDEDCSDLPAGTGCGRFTAPNRICTVDPDPR
jgi:hypothetical protein